MADQRSRGGKKQGINPSSNPEEHQMTRTNQPRPDNSNPSGPGGKQIDELRDDLSPASESGDRKVT